MKKILIVEDHNMLNMRLNQQFQTIEGVEQVDSANSILEATAFIRAELSKGSMYSLFVVDLDLPDGSGYDLIHQIRQTQEYKMVWIIILTGLYEPTDKIVNAYEQNLCTKYVKKPVSAKMMQETVRELLNYIVKPLVQTTICITKKDVKYYFEQDEIVYIETINKHTHIYTINGKVNIGRYSLSRLEKELNEEKFIRVHRAYIINKNHIHQIEKSSITNFIKMKGYDQEIPTGIKYKDPGSV